MAEQRIQYDWQLKSAELATVINCHTTGNPIPLDAFVPKSEEERRREQEENVIHDPAMHKVFRKMLVDMYPEMNKGYVDPED